MSAALYWSDATEAADRVLGDRLTALYPGAAISIGRLCPQCGGSDHGRPWARVDHREVAVSISRAEGHLLVAIGAPGFRAVGVDVESVDRVAQARSWVATEAILKAEGVGLAHDPGPDLLAEFGGELSYPPAPEGFVAALALRR